MPASRGGLLGRLVPLLLLGVVAAYAFLLRCVHLLNPDHYYIISPDSHFFNWEAKLLLRGENTDGTLHSGLTYPLAYFAKTISSVTGASPEEALRLAGILVPPVLGVLSVIAIYLAVSKIYSSRVGLFSAFAWSVAMPAVMTQASGYLDRDGLNLLLIIIGASAFYLAGDWPLRLGRLEVGWLVGGIAVLAVSALLLMEWLWLGAAILVGIVVAMVALEFVIGLASRLVPSLLAEEDPLALPLLFVRKVPPSIVAAVKASSWKPLAVVLVVGLMVAVIGPGTLTLQDMYREGSQLVQDALSGTATVSELQGLTLGDLLSYGLLSIPLLIGLYIAIRSRRRADILYLGWFGVLFLGGLFARRLFLYAAPAVCVIIGLGLASLIDRSKLGLSRGDLRMALNVVPNRLLRYARIAAAVVLVLLLLPPSLSAYQLGSYRLVAANNDWEAALDYLSESTPAEAVVMSWWDYGYWILDIAERKPVVDNGRHSEATDHDIALVYVTKEDSEAVRVMQRYAADYLVFSTVEYGSLPLITELALGERFGDGVSMPRQMRGSLYARSLSGDWEFGGGLKRAYPGPEVAEPRVVILKVE